MAPLPQSPSHSRRAFLINSGWVAAGVTFLTSCSGVIPILPSTSDPQPEDALSWIQLLPDGRVRFYCPRMEMGQGATLGLTQIVAEELNLTQAQIDYQIPRSDQVPPFKMTVGSESIALFSESVSFGAANLREFLRAQAATKNDLDPTQVFDAGGGFDIAGDFLAYRDLVPSNESLFQADQSLDIPRYFHRPPAEHQAIGQNWRSPELENIVTGRTRFSRDIHLPDLLYGEVIRPPHFGATLLSVSDQGTKKLPGVKAVLIDKERNFVGLVCTTPFALAAALENLSVTWSAPNNKTQQCSLDVAPHQEANDFEHTLLEETMAGSPPGGNVQSLGRHYTTPYLAHAAMEPRAAVVQVQTNAVDIWCGCQDPFFVRDRVAGLLGRDREAVRVHPLRMGGGFGGRVLCQPAEEAALLSAAAGGPVRVQWSRETEFQQNYFQPKFSHAIHAKLDANGKIVQWHHDFVSAPIIFGLAPKSVAGILDTFVADKGTARGAVIPYAVNQQRVRYSDIRTEVPTGAWRGLGAAPNTFAIESMMDELAHAAQIDPLAFRLNHLPDLHGINARLAAALSRVGQLCDWGQILSDNQGLGIACAIYKEQTPVAVVAKVRLDPQNQFIAVDQLWCVQDSGRVINPDQVKSQVEGNLIWGCSMALKERMTLNKGQAEQLNFDSYPLLRHKEAPQIQVDLMDRASEKPTAVGESAFAPTVAAIANAVFAASGTRLRQLPLATESLYL